MNKISVVGCTLLLLFTGCLETPVMRRTILLNFPTRENQNKVSLSVKDYEVQQALKLIDTVLVSDGLGSKDPIPSVSNELGAMASYARRDGPDPRPIGGASVYLKDDRLEVVFVEFGNRSGHFSQATRKVFNSLQKELSSNYGAKRVEVE